MLMRKERKIPGSIYKPHSALVLVRTQQLLKNLPTREMLYFPYPQYCQNFKGELLLHIAGPQKFPGTALKQVS